MDEQTPTAIDWQLWQAQLRRHGPSAFRWVLRLVFFAVIAAQLAPMGSRAPLGPPQTVETQQPQVCVHTRLIDEVPEWAMQKSLVAVREMGAGTIVEFFPWAYIEQAPGVYDWSQADKIIKHAQNQGLRVIARMGFVPAWARPDPGEQPTTFNYLPDNSYDSFGDFVALFAARYAGTVDDFIIWNEPNLAFEWGYRSPDPEAYVRLLSEVYPRIKQANPAAQILAGALAPTLEPEGSPHGLSDLIYLERMYAAGARGLFDALAVHTYGFTHPPDDPPAPDKLNFRRAELLHEIMVANGDADTPVYITESGWNDHPRWALAVRPSQRVAYTVDAFRWGADHWPWLDRLCVWALRYPRPTYSYPDSFTLITPDFQVKPIYYAIQNYARGWESDAVAEGSTPWLPAPVEAE